MYYNRFRYYSPETGTYLSQDPIGLSGNNPNFYAYVSNSNSFVDIFGLNGVEPETIKLKHYTSNKGLEGMKQDMNIKAYDQNTVFAERAKGNALSSADVAEKYGIQKSSARNYIEFNVNSERVEIVDNPVTKAREYTVKGDVELGDDAKFFKRCK